MANMTYTIGTVSVAADSIDVTGTGTLWESVNARAWDWISIDGGTPILIAEIIDTTHLKLAWPAPAEKTNVGYVIYQRSPLRFAGGQAMADVSELIALLRSRGLLWYLDPAYTDPSEANPPLVADDGQGMLQIATGKLWVMQGGAWQDAGIFKGINPRGMWNEIDTFQADDLVSDGGGSYLALAANTNDPPPSANWMLIAAKGDAGATGAPGADGTDGVDGAAATIAVGTVTTVPYGTPASVTNVGTPAAAVFDFGIPKGQDGTGTGDMQAANNLSDLANADTALGNLGGTAVGKELFKAADEAAVLSELPNAYHRGNILGTASQSGGVPTGAIIERGSNANGEYIRWADGTQICYRVSRLPAVAVNNGTFVTCVFAAAFANTNYRIQYSAMTEIGSGGQSATGAVYDNGIYTGVYGAGQFNLNCFAYQRAVPNPVDFFVSIIGRWF